MGILDWFTPKGTSIDGGIRGTAQVVSTSGYFGRAVQQNARMNIVLNGQGVTPTAVEYSGLIHNQKWPHAGQVLPALIDPKDPKKYSILWEEVPNSKDAAKTTAEGIAAALAGDPSQLGSVLANHAFSNVSVVGNLSSVTAEQKAKLAAFGIDLDALAAQAGAAQAGAVQTMDGAAASSAMTQLFGAAAAGAAGSAAASAESTTSALERLAALHKGGSLTDAEFTEAKRKLLH